jgi:hypothetical protein
MAKRLQGLTPENKNELYNLLINDPNFTYSYCEGGFYGKYGVIVSINRTPYQCSLYESKETTKIEFNEVYEYVMEKWNNRQPDVTPIHKLLP